MASISISTPAGGEILTSEHSLHVSGRAVGHGEPEPVGVDGVAVSVDGGPPVQASLQIPPHETVPAVLFGVTVPALTGEGTHTISADATFDNGSTAHAAVSVEVRNVASAAFTPRESLQVTVVNPASPPSVNWAADLVKADRTPIHPSATELLVWKKTGDAFPICAREWVQVLDPGEDYDRDTVGFTGWVLQPELAKTDVPFTHPFRSDWECMVALDQEYTGLLARGNVVPDGVEAMADAAQLQIPVPDGGLLAVEMDQNCVPSTIKDINSGTVLKGDRIAVFGRWIVDSGHAVADPTGAEDSYRAEVHPPLLMAIGGTRTDPVEGRLTRVALTSRPYLPKQVFTTDKASIYDDSGPDDGTMLEHLLREADKLTSGIILPDSTTLEAHPKISSKPFSGTHVFRLTVRPPDTPAVAGHGGHGVGLGGVLAETVEVSFQFTCRTGVGVEVLGNVDHVDLLISLNSLNYTPPPLPTRQTEVWDKDRLNAEQSGSGAVITAEQFFSLFTANPAETASAEAALAHGIETDRYEVPDVNVFSRSQAVPFTSVDQIPGDQGIVINDNQPYPVVGFLEIRRHRPDQIHGGGETAGAVPDQPAHQIHTGGKQA
jgi:hypothetical protein